MPIAHETAIRSTNTALPVGSARVFIHSHRRAVAKKTSGRVRITGSSRSGVERVTSDRCSTGIEGLDAVLEGGLAPNHVYLLAGDPGTGKTTVGLQFLLAGRAAGERGMYITLSETSGELRASAESHGWSLDGVDIMQLAEVQSERADEAYTLFHPSEVEFQHTVEIILKAIADQSPVRIVVDSLSEMRLLARDALRFRRQILALKQFFAGRRCTRALSGQPDGARRRSPAS